MVLKNYFPIAVDDEHSSKLKRVGIRQSVAMPGTQRRETPPHNPSVHKLPKSRSAETKLLEQRLRWICNNPLRNFHSALKFSRLFLITHADEQNILVLKLAKARELFAAEDTSVMAQKN